MTETWRRRADILFNAVIAAICQKGLHFMIAAYRSSCSRAHHLGDEDAATLLEQSFPEEEAAGLQVTRLAELLHRDAAWVERMRAAS